MRHFIVFVFVLSACSGNAGTPDTRVIADAPLVFDAQLVDARSPDGRPPADAPPPDASIASLSCNQLSAAVRARLDVLDNSCKTVNDCTAIVSISSDRWCDAVPSIVIATSKVAAADPDVLTLVAEWDGRCKDASCGVAQCTADQAPPTPACSADQHCVDTHQESCFPTPDAGP